jgi:thioredoxin-related protein
MIYKYLVFSVLLVSLSAQGWRYNLQEAEDLAKKEHKHILLNFSGSDWCGPCILLRKEVFDSPEFLQMADSELVLVNADFPRKKKNQPSPDQQRINNEIADRYNPQGQFPLTLLLNADGKALKAWYGNPGITPAAFSAEVKENIDADQ